MRIGIVSSIPVEYHHILRLTAIEKSTVLRYILYPVLDTPKSIIQYLIPCFFDAYKAICRAFPIIYQHIPNIPLYNVQGLCMDVVSN